jgi:hypothetical protein
MDKNTITTLNFIDDNKEMRKKLFGIKKDDKFIQSFLKNKTFDIYTQSVNWVFKALFDEHLILGFNESNQIIGLTQESESVIVCDRLENLPYEVIRQELKIHQDTKTYFTLYPERKELLNTYENWAYSQKIMLDFRHAYHFENGEMFYRYFE